MNTEPIFASITYPETMERREVLETVKAILQKRKYEAAPELYEEEQNEAGFSCGNLLLAEGSYDRLEKRGGFEARLNGVTLNIEA